MLTIRRHAAMLLRALLLLIRHAAIAGATLLLPLPYVIISPLPLRFRHAHASAPLLRTCRHYASADTCYATCHTLMLRGFTLPRCCHTPLLILPR